MDLSYECQTCTFLTDFARCVCGAPLRPFVQIHPSIRIRHSASPRSSPAIEVPRRISALGKGFIMDCHFAKAAPRSPKPSLQQMYKKKKSLTPWKETYRQRCLDRVKSNRSNLVSKFRALSSSDATPFVEEMMAAEWQTMCAEHASASHASFDSFKNENIDRVNSIFEEMKIELLREEQAIVADYEANQQYDAAALESALTRHEEAAPQLSFLSPHQGEAQVCCPICQRNPLMLNKGVIFCSCGARIDTEQDCISLEFVGRNLAEATQMHSIACQQVAPQFSIVKQLGIDNLLMTCAECDFWFVVI